MLIPAGSDNAHSNQRRGPDMTPEITLVLAVPGFIIFRFVAEALCVDVIAILIMLALEVTTDLPPGRMLQGSRNLA